MQKRSNKAKYSAKRQKEQMVIMGVMAALVIIILLIVVGLVDDKSESYAIGPVVKFQEEETETGAQNESQESTDSRIETDTEKEAMVSTENETETPMAKEVSEGLYAWNNHYYAFYDNVGSWEEAIAYCQEKGGYMASITSDEESAAVYSLMSNAGIQNAYFGWYLDEEHGLWQWVNGEEVLYENWHAGEPNAERSSEKYGMFYYKYKDGTWNDGDFGSGTANGGTVFICEWNSYPSDF